MVDYGNVVVVLVDLVVGCDGQYDDDQCGWNVFLVFEVEEQGECDGF